MPSFRALPEIDGTLTPTFILLNFDQRLCIIGGSGYGGEIKKSVFTVLNYILPLQGVMTMHCSANIGKGGDVALFFGLSGTGKTTLSAVARIVGASKSSVFRWYQEYQEGWSKALRSKTIPGRPPKLSHSEKGTLTELLLSGPLSAGYRTDLWTLKRIAQTIQKHFGVRYHPRSRLATAGARFRPGESA